MNFVIIGSGQAAAQIIISLTQKKFQGTITVIGDEPYLPYQRPPLSKKFLSGALDEEQLFFRPQNFYDTHGIRLVLGQAAVRLERDNQRVICADGREFAYDKLVFATGAHPRPFKHNLGNIFNLHRLDDVKAIHPHLLSGRRLVIIGGGFIGLEVAASARQLGLDVVVLEAEARPLMRAAHEQISRFLMRVHAEEGVIIRPQCQVAEFIGTEGVSGVVLQTGEQFTADLVIIGIGVLPNSALAEAAGLEVDNGIMVDAYGQTSDGDIYAAGDCTNHPNELLGCRLRLESVHNAIEQAKTVASALCNQPRYTNRFRGFGQINMMSNCKWRDLTINRVIMLCVEVPTMGVVSRFFILPSNGLFV